MQSEEKLHEKRVTATAPGKLILFGEHAVVYGTKAVATCLSNLRLQVSIQSTAPGGASDGDAGGAGGDKEEGKGKGFVEFDLPGIGGANGYFRAFGFETLEPLFRAAEDAGLRCRSPPSREVELSAKLLECIRSVVSDEARESETCLLYLISSIMGHSFLGEFRKVPMASDSPYPRNQMNMVRRCLWALVSALLRHSP